MSGAYFWRRRPSDLPHSCLDGPKSLGARREAAAVVTTKRRLLLYYSAAVTSPSTVTRQHPRYHEDTWCSQEAISGMGHIPSAATANPARSSRQRSELRIDNKSAVRSQVHICPQKRGTTTQGKCAQLKPVHQHSGTFTANPPLDVSL